MLDRREMLAGLGPGALAGLLAGPSLVGQSGDDQKLTVESLESARWISGLELDERQRKEILDTVQRNAASLAKLRAIKLDEETPMALSLVPLEARTGHDSIIRSTTVELPSPFTTAKRPADEALAFLPLLELSELLRSRQVSSVELTRLYLERLEKFDPVLLCVVGLAAESALEQAQRADQEIGLGRYRGPLHGIPWGAKDLISVSGQPFTWGIPDRKGVVAKRNATVAQRLEDAGAVMVAKLSLGALAMGDKWFGGLTRNPWNPEQGSSGSSAGSAAAVVAGLVGFAIGSETLGSIVSPSARCGATSLRPTFGRISRDGCMPLAWSFDKLGPMARSVEDLAIVFAAIHGADQRDPSARTAAFHWPTELDLRRVRVGVPERMLDDTEGAVPVLREMGVQLSAVKLPDQYPLDALLHIIDVESAAMFDESLRAGKTDGWNQWPAIFRSACYLSAVDYVRMQRVRLQLMRDFQAAVAGLDFWVDANDLLHTNLTGHPSVVLPRVIELKNGAFRARTTVLSGQIDDDDRLLAFAREFERRVPGGLEHPPMQRWLDEKKKPDLSNDLPPIPNPDNGK